jgi:hypothetical protein
MLYARQPHPPPHPVRTHHTPCTTGESKSRSEEDIQVEQQPLSKPEAGATTKPAEAQPTGGLSALGEGGGQGGDGGQGGGGGKGGGGEGGGGLGEGGGGVTPADSPPTRAATAEQSPPEELSSAVEKVPAKNAKEELWDAQVAEESSRRRAAEAPVAPLECGGADYISEAGAQAQVRTPRKPGGEGGAVSPRNMTSGQLKRELKSRGAEPPEGATRDAMREMLFGLLSDEDHL